MWGKWTWLIQIEASAIVNIVNHKHTMINNCDNTLPCSTALIRFENMLIRRVSSVRSPEYYICLRLRVLQWIAARSQFKCDMMVKVKVNTLIWLMNRSFIIRHTCSICVLNTIFEHWICSSGSTDKHTRSVLFRYAIFKRWICPSGSNDEHSTMELSLRYV